MTIFELIEQLRNDNPLYADMKQRISAEMWTTTNIKEAGEQIGIQLNYDDIEKIHDKLDEVSICHEVVEIIRAVVAKKFKNSEPMPEIKEQSNE